MGRRFYRPRRSYRRRNSKLSTRKIFSRTGAKSQAKQIYALRRRVTTLSRRVKPELKVKDSSITSFDLHNAAWTNSYQAYTLQWPAQGDAVDQRVGTEFKVKNIMIRLNLEYYNNSETGYYANNSAGTPVRIIVIKTVGPVLTNFETSLDTILQHSGYSGGDYTARSISPFKRSVTQQFKIVSNKLVNLTSDKNQRSIFISVGRNQNINFNPGGQAVHYLLYIAPSGLHYDTEFKEHVKGTMVYRITYTDV